MVGYDISYGYFVTVQLTGRSLWAHACHMKGPSPLSVGDRVALDDLLGGVGATGAYAQGNHVHSMLTTGPRLADNAIDPLPYITAAIAAATSKETTVYLVRRNSPGDTSVLAGIVGVFAPGYFRHIGNQSDVDALVAFGLPVHEVDAAGWTRMLAVFNVPDSEARPGKVYQAVANSAEVTDAQVTSLANRIAAKLPTADSILHRFREFWASGK